MSLLNLVYMSHVKELSFYISNSLEEHHNMIHNFNICTVCFVDIHKKLIWKNSYMYLKQQGCPCHENSHLHGNIIRLLGVGCCDLTPLTLSQVEDSYKASKESQNCCIPFIHENIFHPFLNNRVYFWKWIDETNLKFGIFLIKTIADMVTRTNASTCHELTKTTKHINMQQDPGSTSPCSCSVA